VAARKLAGPVGLLRRSRERQQADRLLRVSEGRWESHPSVAWRVEELTSPRERRAIARSLRGIVRDVSKQIFGAAPVNRYGLLPYVLRLTRLADRIGDLDRPATGAGMLLVRDLLTDGGSPLYTGGCADDLPAALARIRTTLDVH
jgi:hypothetical protein